MMAALSPILFVLACAQLRPSVTTKISAEELITKSRSEQFIARLQELNTLSFEVDLTLDDNMNYLFKSMPETHSRKKLLVWMATGNRFRIEVMGEKSPETIILCDGAEVTEWSASENIWTRHPIKSPMESKGMPFLLDDPYKEDITLGDMFWHSWIGGNGYPKNRLTPILADRETHRKKSIRFDGHQCDVLQKSERGFRFPYHVSGIDEFYLDSTTHMIRRYLHSWKTHGIVNGERKTETIYRNIRENVHLPKTIFSWMPPEDSKYFSPDDRRFTRPKPLLLDGKPALAFTAISVDGDSISLASYKGKGAVLLVFWATWCPPCNREIPTLRTIHKEFAHQGLTILAVSTDQNIPAVKYFAKRHHLPYTVLYDDKQAINELYHITAIPRTMLIDKEGVVRKTWQGWSGKEEEAEIRRELAKLLR